MKIIEIKVIMRTFAMILVVLSMFPHNNSVSLRFYKTCSLTVLLAVIVTIVCIQL